MNRQEKKIISMSPGESSDYMSTANRVTVGKVSTVVKNADGKNVFKTWYVAKIRGVIVGNKGEWKHETYDAARRYGGEILLKWRAEYKKSRGIL